MTEQATTKPYRVAFIRGGPEDESGPELADAVMAVLSRLLEVNGGPRIDWVEVEAGTHCFKKHGTFLPAESLATILDLGIALKAPTASLRVPGRSEPIAVTLRRELGTHYQINELRSYHGVRTAIAPGADVLLVQDNSEGLISASSQWPSSDLTVDLRVISRVAARRVARVGFELARARSKRVAVCALATLRTDQLFISGCEEEAEQYPDVTWWVRKPDSFAGTVVADAGQYDVVVAPKDWGFVMTDLFAAACGSVGLAARANVGEATAYFEPIHGTAPGKAGKGTVNPVGQITAGKLLLEWIGRTFGDESAINAAGLLKRAVSDVLDSGEFLTVDLGGTSSTAQITGAIIDRLAATVSASSGTKGDRGGESSYESSTLSL